MPDIPDAEFYRPLFSPWLGYGEFAAVYARIRGYTLVSADRCHVLYQLARQALHLSGAWYEAGVYRGGTAAMLAGVLGGGSRGGRLLRLFDTFEGMPATDPAVDLHRQGDFRDTTLEAVANLLRRSTPDPSFIVLHRGRIPQSFAGLGADAVSFAHVDVDIYASVLDCCRFIYPRLVPGGFMVFDDYGFPTCPGARKAVDEYFAATPSHPLVLPTGQAVVFKSQPLEVGP